MKDGRCGHDSRYSYLNMLGYEVQTVPMTVKTCGIRRKSS